MDTTDTKLIKRIIVAKAIEGRLETLVKESDTQSKQLQVIEYICNQAIETQEEED